MSKTLPNLLDRSREIHEDHVLYRYGNGLVVKTDLPLRDDTTRVLGLGVPQGAFLNLMLNFPEQVEGKRVLDPFAGSGVLGLMALKQGAARVEFVDLSARAVAFQEENVRLNGFEAHRCACIEASIEDYAPAQPFDFIFCNPPFVPTPDALAGTVTSNGGSDGNLFVKMLLRRLDLLLAPEGQAYIYLMQLVRAGEPLIAGVLEELVRNRAAELTPTQAEPMLFSDYVDAYLRAFASSREATETWARSVQDSCGTDATVEHYALHLRPRTQGHTTWAITDNLSEKYGEGLRIEDPSAALALGRVMENFLASTT